MKYLFSLAIAFFAMILSPLSSNADVLINEANFPDDNFRAWLVEQDYGADGILTESEILNISLIDVSYKQISNLKGIEFFTALTELDCSGNSLTSLDVSNCTALSLLSIHHNKITGVGMDNLINSLPTNTTGNKHSIYLFDNESTDDNFCIKSQVAAIKEKGWTPYDGTTEYECYYDGIVVNETNFPDANFRTKILQIIGLDVIINPVLQSIINIDVSNKKIRNLKGIEFFTALETLHCEHNQLTSLDVSKNTALTWLYCYGNELTSLDVSKNTELQWLECYFNKLTSLNVSQNTALVKLYCYGNELTSLNVSNCTALLGLYCNSNPLTSLNVSQNTALRFLQCMTNQLTSLNVSKNTALQTLYCCDNKLTSLDVSNNPELAYLNCSRNKISGENMDNLINSLPQIENGEYCKFNVFDNSRGDEENVFTPRQVAAVKAKGWTPFYYDGNRWIEYEGSDDGITIDKTKFPDANFRNYLWTQSYGADGVLTYSEIQSITDLDIAEKQIGSLMGIEYFTALTYLDCGFNQLTSLDVSKNTLLTGLYCNNNQLTSLDISKNTALTRLWCYENQLASLDVSKNTALRALSCFGNQLTTLDVSKITALTSLHIDHNKIKGAGMSNLINSLPVNLTEDKHSIHVLYSSRSTVVEEGNVCTKSQVAAIKAKGWTPYDGIDEYEGSIDTDPDDIVINEANFPDANFRNYLLKQSYGQDGVITEEEIQGITDIDVAEEQIGSLKGIEYFTALTYLDCGSNKMTSLDVSMNTALEFLDCKYNQLTSLDVSNCSALKELHCHYNQLTSLDVSNCTALKELRCFCNQLTSLDVSDCTALTTLYIDHNKISGGGMYLLIGGLPTNSTGNKHSIYVLYSSRKTNVEEGNVCTKTQASIIKQQGWTPYDGETEYNGSSVIVINDINFPDANFRNYLNNQEYGKDGLITESEMESITEMIVTYSEISNLKGIEYFTALKRLLCYSNQLTSLDVSKNTALTYLSCSSNLLTSLDVSKNTALEHLYCYNNQLNSLDVSKNTALIYLNCNDNQLTTLDVSKNTALTNLSIYHNNIKGVGMDDLINSLPVNTTESKHTIYVLFSNLDNEREEGNVCTKTQVEAIKAKGWTPQNGAAEYEGCDVMGDANGDDVVDVADVVAIVNYILEKPGENFNFKAADVNGDKVIDAADVVGVVNIILDKGNVKSAQQNRP